MRCPCRLLPCLVLATQCFAATVQPFDSGWRFLKSDASAAETPQFDDSRWRAVTLPHDWAIEGPFDEKNPAGQASAWLPASDTQRHVFIDFDGVMANSDVWINGIRLGKRPYGYISFRYASSAGLAQGSVTIEVGAK